MRVFVCSLAAALFALAGCDELAGGRRSAPAMGTVETPAPEPLPEVVEAPPAPVNPEVRVEPGQAFDAQLSFTEDVVFEPVFAQTVRDISEITVRTSVVGAQGPHTLRLEFESPSGARYQGMAQEISAEPNARAEAHFQLPVARTAIDAFNLEGAWTARLFFDGREVSSRTFELLP